MNYIQNMAKWQAEREAYNSGIEAAIVELRHFEASDGWIEERLENLIKAIRRQKRTDV